MRKAFQSADNTGSPALNYIKNAVAVGANTDRGAALKNLDATNNTLIGELANALTNAGATVSGIEDLKKNLNNTATPKQADAVIKGYLPLMAEKMMEKGNAYEKTMGKRTPLLTPESVATLKELGFDPSKFDPTLSGKTGQTTKQETPFHSNAAALSIRQHFQDGTINAAQARQMLEALK